MLHYAQNTEYSCLKFFLIKTPFYLLVFLHFYLLPALLGNKTSLHYYTFLEYYIMTAAPSL